MEPIKLSCFTGGVRKVVPRQEILNNLEQFMSFFTAYEPPTVKKAERKDFFSMAMFKPGTTRCKQNVVELSGMVLDFDNIHGYSSLPEFIASLKPLGIIYLYYTTWSHTTLHHRWRLVLPFAKAISVTFWPDAYSRVLKLLGNPNGIDTAASKDVARMWIMPCKAPGQPYEIGYQTTGKFLDPHALPFVAKPTIPESLSLEFAKFPQATSEDVREALSYLDPDADYDIWLKIGMALQDAFGEAGLQIWDAWSAKGRKYKNFKDLQMHWQTFAKNAGVTIASLFHYAKTQGYYRKLHSAYMKPHGENQTVIEALQVKSSEAAAPIKSLEVFEVNCDADPVTQCVKALKPFAVKDIFDFPCTITKEVFDWIQSVAPLPQPIFSFSATLSVMAFLKRNAVVSATNLKTNLYVMVIGPSRSGKNNTLDSINDILQTLELQEFATSGFGSAQGLMKQLNEKKGQAYWVQDEIVHLFKNFQNKNAGTYETRLEQKILTLYNCSYQTSDKIKNEQMFVVQNPYLNIFGTTTENIIEILTPESIISGLLTRFLVFWLKPGDATADYNTKNIDRTLPQSLVSALSTIAKQQQPQKVCLSNDAEMWLQKFSTVLKKSQQALCQKGTKVDSLVGNLREQTIKIALLVAKDYTSTVNKPVHQNQPSKSSIGLADLQWAASVALHCFFNNLELACSLTENKNEKYVNKILQYLAEHQGKWIRRSSLCKLLRYAINARQLEDLLVTLLESGAIIKTTTNAGALYHFNRHLTPRIT